MPVNLLTIWLRRLILVTPRNVTYLGELWTPAAGISRVYPPDYLDTTTKFSAAALEKLFFLLIRTDDDYLTVDIWIERCRRLPHGKFQSCVSTTQWKCFVPHAPEIYGQQSNAKSFKTYSAFFRLSFSLQLLLEFQMRQHEAPRNVLALLQTLDISDARGASLVFKLPRRDVSY